MGLTLVAARIFGTPLMVSPSKLDAILGAPDLAARLGIPAPMAAQETPESEPKRRRASDVVARPTSIEVVNTARGSARMAAPESRVVVVQVVGTLANRVDSLDAMSGMTGYETLGEEIDRLAADPAVDGILLEVDSFGGEAAGCFDAADRIAAACQVKPVVGIANQYAMSAGYALLSQADQIFVPQSAEVGSIGVVTTHMDMTTAAEKAGVRVTHIFAGKHKADLSSFKALAPEVRDRLQADVGQIYDQFVGVVARGRGDRLSVDAAKATEALTFIGQKAVDAGLADQVGDKAAALDALFAQVEDRRMDKELAAKAARQEAEIATLKAEVDRFKRAETERLAAEDAAYLESIAKRSADAQNPIDATKLAKVKAHLDAGRREIARELGDELLEASLARGGRTFTKVPAAPPADPHTAAAARGLERLRSRKNMGKKPEKVR